MGLRLLLFFPLADAIDERGGPLFPGIRFVVNITFLALEMNKWPSEVFAQYLRQPKDIELIMAALETKRKAEDKEKNRLEDEQEKIRRRQRM